eukprot:12781492-Prorocentrum_lima.AAC.1
MPHPLVLHSCTRWALFAVDELLQNSGQVPGFVVPVGRRTHLPPMEIPLFSCFHIVWVIKRDCPEGAGVRLAL